MELLCSKCQQAGNFHSVKVLCGACTIAVSVSPAQATRGAMHWSASKTVHHSCKGSLFTSSGAYITCRIDPIAYIQVALAVNEFNAPRWLSLPVGTSNAGSTLLNARGVPQKSKVLALLHCFVLPRIVIGRVAPGHFLWAIVIPYASTANMVLIHCVASGLSVKLQMHLPRHFRLRGTYLASVTTYASVATLHQ